MLKVPDRGLQVPESDHVLVAQLGRQAPRFGELIRWDGHAHGAIAVQVGRQLKTEKNQRLGARIASRYQNS
jgi:hypothetical protein